MTTLTFVVNNGVLIPSQEYSALTRKAAVNFNLPDGNDITSIGDGTFRDCAKLTDIAFSSSVTFVGSNAFQRCIGLKSISFSGDIISIGDNAFEGCISLTGINLSIKHIANTTLGNNIFQGCTKLIDARISKLPNLTKTGSNIFMKTPHETYWNNYIPLLLYSINLVSWHEFRVIPGIRLQTISVPDWAYFVTAYVIGGGGGNSAYNGGNGGYIWANFSLTDITNINIYVGDAGSNGSVGIIENIKSGGGGGGSSAVFLEYNKFIVAGGGGGGGTNNNATAGNEYGVISGGGYSGGAAGGGGGFDGNGGGAGVNNGDGGKRPSENGLGGIGNISTRDDEGNGGNGGNGYTGGGGGGGQTAPGYFTSICGGGGGGYSGGGGGGNFNGQTISVGAGGLGGTCFVTNAYSGGTTSVAYNATTLNNTLTQFKYPSKLAKPTNIGTSNKPGCVILRFSKKLLD